MLAREAESGLLGSTTLAASNEMPSWSAVVLVVMTPYVRPSPSPPIAFGLGATPFATSSADGAGPPHAGALYTTVSPVCTPCGSEKVSVFAPVCTLPIVPSESSGTGPPWFAEIVNVSPACTKPPSTSALAVGSLSLFVVTRASATSSAWMFTMPPLVASAKASASVWESAKTSTSFVAVTLPEPSLAATVGAVSAVALEALTATIPIPNVSTLASVESFARAETSMSNAPATPTVPSDRVGRRRADVPVQRRSRVGRSPSLPGG